MQVRFVYFIFLGFSNFFGNQTFEISTFVNLRSQILIILYRLGSYTKYLDARRFLYNAKEPISAVDNGSNTFNLHGVDGEKLVDVDDWCDFVRRKGDSYFYSGTFFTL